MSAALKKKISATRFWLRSDYLGAFEGERVELIEGEVVIRERLSWEEVYASTALDKNLREIFDDDCWVYSRGEIHLGENSAPEPDVSVIAGNFESYFTHPTTALLIIEVSEETLRYDRERKAELYAKHDIAEYWILDLFGRKLEVRTKPGKNEFDKFVYKNSDVFGAGESVSPLARPDAKISVADLLPPENLIKKRN